MKCYTDGLAVGVTNQLRKDGDAVRARDRYRKWWILKNVMFAVDTDPPSPAPPLPVLLVGFDSPQGNILFKDLC